MVTELVTELIALSRLTGSERPPESAVVEVDNDEGEDSSGPWVTFHRHRSDEGPAEA